jgi:hypothetical protein
LFYDAFYDFSGTPTTSYVTSVVETYNWRVIDAVGTSEWLIISISTVHSTLATRPGQLAAVDVVGISSRRVIDIMGTFSWRATYAMGVVGAAPATSALTSSGMSTYFS